ncbi:sigma-70 family RNA polymerase sigma factor [Paenibacillus sp. HN-1]|uniref:hypothetical protein n=1 Tax=Paenibacillus TaxID=44249 RepID=UPI001CA88A6F|nr:MULTISPECIES: hypothetical protein [Paenibacillus]MBY9081216.1 sigma-70 family RNA polymerase sigma factor [Paenibacillus sp. CGMCC 1.18879]MBY9087253.1 sigma-70 family RNA polymerase sigma factor [Paenibacillus sinensis]
MNKDRVIEILNNMRSYEYAIKSSAGHYSGPMMPLKLDDLNRNRMPADMWDHERYSRIVSVTRGAIDEVLSDDQRKVIMNKYIDRNKMSLKQIAEKEHRDRGTISVWHTEALKSLAAALKPLDVYFLDINNLDEFFDKGIILNKPA